MTPRGDDGSAVHARRFARALGARVTVADLDWAGVLDGLGHGVLVLDPDLRIVWWNRWMEERSHRLRAEVVGRALGEVFPAIDATAFAGEVDPVFRLGRAASFAPGAEHPALPLPARANGPSGAWMPQTVRLSPLRDAEGRVGQVCVTVLDATEIVAARVEAEAAAAKLLASHQEKSLLLSEIHHRVKNNLQMISSLLRLQAGSLSDPMAVSALAEAQARVRSIALLHERLYGSGEFGVVEMRPYVRGLLVLVVDASGSSARGVVVEQSVADLALPFDVAVPCALILNELLTNAFKHAFPAAVTERRVCASVGRDGDHVVLEVRDSGVGLPPTVDLERGRSLGLRLVRMLASQVDGVVEVSRSPGATIRVRFPDPTRSS